MNDTANDIAKREKMVLDLKKAGIRDQRVLQAIEKIPRHFFFNNAFQQFAYDNVAMQIGEGQCISQPWTVAYQTELLEMEKGMKILEIGLGSGYQAAILGAMGATVYSMERNKKLHDKAKVLLLSLGSKVTCVFGDGYNGLSKFAPYDRIIVTTAPEFVPESLLEQLKLGGVIVIPVGGSGEKDGRVMKKIVKNKEGDYEIKDYGVFR